MSQDWWAQKLGGGAPQRAPSTPPLGLPAPVPFNPANATSYRTPVAYDANTDQVTSKAQHFKNFSTCPSCGSGNYMKLHPANANSPYRCFDCGYPVEQSSSGLVGNSEGPATPAQQVSTANNFNPNVIIGHIH